MVGRSAAGAAAALFSACIAGALAGHFRSGDPPLTVSLLVTRHGQACHNLLSDMGPGLVDMGGNRIPDAMLTGFGMAECEKARADLKSEAGDVDAIISSELARAIQTAWLVYNGNEFPGSKKVFVVPFLKEKNRWGFSANEPLSDTYVQRLKIFEALFPERVSHDEEQFSQVFDGIKSWVDGKHIDYTYLEEALHKRGKSPAGTWKKFKRFLLQHVLPKLVHETGKRHFTLAVVTHSHLIAKSEVGGHCKGFYAGASKPYNTQTFRVEYKWDKEGLTLASDKVCTQLSGGTQSKAFKVEDYCLKDIGPVCARDWRAHTRSGGGFVERASKNPTCQAADDVSG